MNQKENLVVKGKVKTKDGYQYKETKLDIYQLHDKKGESLGDKLTNYKKRIEDLEARNTILMETKIKEAVDKIIKEYGNL